MYKRSRWLSALLVALLVLGFAPAASAQYTPEVFAVDHDLARIGTGNAADDVEQG